MTRHIVLTVITFVGYVVITDFGLAKEGVHNSFSGAHSFCGTPEYLGIVFCYSELGRKLTAYLF
jgi:hypothetical protein